jgi:hypothetical protein
VSAASSIPVANVRSANPARNNLCLLPEQKQELSRIYDRDISERLEGRETAL